MNNEAGRKIRNRKIRAVLRIILSVCIFTAVIFAFSLYAGKIRRNTNVKGAETLRESIRKATVECYAIEGRYPPNVKYLQDHYGIRIDRNRYNVFYEGFASNIIPDITVTENTPPDTGNGSGFGQDNRKGR
jgi:uncharacterized protein (DUF4213/DUF364 family)